MQRQQFLWYVSAWPRSFSARRWERHSSRKIHSMLETIGENLDLFELHFILLFQLVPSIESTASCSRFEGSSDSIVAINPTLGLGFFILGRFMHLYCLNFTNSAGSFLRTIKLKIR